MAQNQAVIKVLRGEIYKALRQSIERDPQSESVVDAGVASWSDLPYVMLHTRVPTVGELWTATFIYEDWQLENQSRSQGRAEYSGLIDFAARAPDELAHEILAADEERDWVQLRELILAAEDVGFTREQSDRLSPRLLDLALKHRDSTDPADRAVVWSAIRTGASMLSTEDADRLRPLLEPGHAVETTLVTVKMLGRIWEAQPPSAADACTDLAAEVGRIARSLLNPYAIASSQSAALAQLAIYALGAMASSELHSMAATIRGIGQRWFARQTSRDLQRLLKEWSSLPAPAPNAPREVVERFIRAIAPT